jgi:hypothetical protein
LVAAKKLSASLPLNETSTAGLRPLIAIGDELQMQLQQRWQIWQQFVRDRDDANARLDSLHGLLNNAAAQPQRSADTVQHEVEQLKVRTIIPSQSNAQST